MFEWKNPYIEDNEQTNVKEPIPFGNPFKIITRSRTLRVNVQIDEALLEGSVGGGGSSQVQPQSPSAQSTKSEPIDLFLSDQKSLSSSSITPQKEPKFNKKNRFSSIFKNQSMKVLHKAEDKISQQNVKSPQLPQQQSQSSSIDLEEMNDSLSSTSTLNLIELQQQIQQQQQSSINSIEISKQSQQPTQNQNFKQFNNEKIDEIYSQVPKIIKTENELKNAYNYVTMEFNGKYLNYEERVCNQYLINNVDNLYSFNKIIYDPLLQLEEKILKIEEFSTEILNNSPNPMARQKMSEKIQDICKAQNLKIKQLH